MAAGVAVILFGLASAWMAWGYPLGRPSAIGPGGMPFVISLLLALLGVGIVVEGAVTETDPASLRLRPIGLLFASLIGFALTLPRFGLLPATLVLIVLSSLAHHEPKPAIIVGNIVLMFLIGGFVFVDFIGLPLDLVAW